MSRRPGAVVAAHAAAVAALLATVGSVAAGGPPPRAVVELFTSQGCGKCPPADALLTRLAADPGLLALSFAVDYWDYLGWKDSAAKPEFTQRQRAYSEVRGDRSVYTPQMVINGRTHVVGSDHDAITRAVTEQAREAKGPTVEVEAEITTEALVVRVADAPAALAAASARATVWLVRYDRARTIPIPKGENSGKTVTYTHLVKALQPIGMWKGKALRIELPRQEKTADPGEGCAVLLQVEGETGPGPILGARVIDQPGS